MKAIWRYPIISIVVVAALAAGGVSLWRHWGERHLRAGEESLEARDHAKAREHFESYLAIHPHSAAARLLAARAARRQKDFDGALEHLRRCREDGGDRGGVARGRSLRPL